MPQLGMLFYVLKVPLTNCLFRSALSLDYWTQLPVVLFGFPVVLVLVLMYDHFAWYSWSVYGYS